MHQVCYYAIPREGSDPTAKQLQVQDIDPFLCSHILIGFAKVDKNELQPVKESDIEVYKEVISLKTQNPKLLVVLSVGGGCGFSTLVRDPEAVAQFSRKAVEFLQSFGFDGIDLDWEFPAWPVLLADCREKRWFTSFLEQLSSQLKLSPTAPLMLTLAVAASKTIIDKSYEVDRIAKYVDFVSMMGYDYHIFWPYLPFTGHNAPLTKRRFEVGYFATMNIEWSAEYWVKKGMPKDKLVIGVPTYGRTWKLLNQGWHNVASPAIGEGMLKGEVSYPQAYFFINEGAERGFDTDSRVPYAWRERDWISYDDTESIREKAKWVRDSRFAGIMTWNLNCDDWAGECSGRKFELHNIIKEVISAKDNEACNRGCRFYTISKFVNQDGPKHGNAVDGSDANPVKKSCESACVDAYNATSRSTIACKFGCESQDAKAEEAKKKAKDEGPSMHLLSPLMQVRSVYSSFIGAIHIVRSSLVTYFVSDDSQIIAVESEPQIIMEVMSGDEKKPNMEENQANFRQVPLKKDMNGQPSRTYLDPGSYIPKPHIVLLGVLALSFITTLLIYSICITFVPRKSKVYGEGLSIQADALPLPVKLVRPEDLTKLSLTEEEEDGNLQAPPLPTKVMLPDTLI